MWMRSRIGWWQEVWWTGEMAMLARREGRELHGRRPQRRRQGLEPVFRRHPSQPPPVISSFNDHTPIWLAQNIAMSNLLLSSRIPATQLTFLNDQSAPSPKCADLVQRSQGRKATRPRSAVVFQCNLKCTSDEVMSCRRASVRCPSLAVWSEVVYRVDIGWSGTDDDWGGLLAGRKTDTPLATWEPVPRMSCSLFLLSSFHGTHEP